MIEMRLALVCGHTPKNFGSMATTPISRGEHFFCLDLCNVAYRFARECGLNAKVFARTDTQTIEEIYAEVNDWCKGNEENTVAIEVHFNASPAHNARGTETLFIDEKNIEFARTIHDAICDVLNRKGKHNRGIKKLQAGDRGLINLKQMKVTGCLIEPFFGDELTDAALGFMKSWEIAQALARASFKYLIQKEAENPLLDKT